MLVCDSGYPRYYQRPPLVPASELGCFGYVVFGPDEVTVYAGKPTETPAGHASTWYFDEQALIKDGYLVVRESELREAAIALHLGVMKC